MTDIDRALQYRSGHCGGSTITSGARGGLGSPERDLRVLIRPMVITISNYAFIRWSQLVTLVTTGHSLSLEASDLNINGAHAFLGPMASNQELVIRRRARRRRNASLIDLLASPQVKRG